MCDYKIPTESPTFDKLNQNISKGKNPLTVAQLSYQRSEASVSRRNTGIRTCAEGTTCAFAGANSNKIQQMLSNQPLYDLDGNPQGAVHLTRRGSERAHDYYAGRQIGSERSQRLYRASLDSRYCSRYCCKDSMLQSDGTIDDTIASKELSTAIYAGSKFVNRVGPSWADEASDSDEFRDGGKRTLEEMAELKRLRTQADRAGSRGTAMDADTSDSYDRPGAGYDDADNRR